MWGTVLARRRACQQDDGARAGGEKAPYRARAGGEKAPYRARAGGEKAPYRARAGGEKAPYRARAGGEKAPYRARAGGDHFQVCHAGGDAMYLRSHDPTDALSC